MSCIACYDSGDSISATEYPNERGGSCMSLLRGSLHCWRDSVKVLADLNIPWAYV